jgi:hypothetical protein
MRFFASAQSDQIAELTAQVAALSIKPEKQEKPEKPVTTFAGLYGALMLNDDGSGKRFRHIAELKNGEDDEQSCRAWNVNESRDWIAQPCAHAREILLSVVAAQSGAKPTESVRARGISAVPPSAERRLAATTHSQTPRLCAVPPRQRAQHEHLLAPAPRIKHCRADECYPPHDRWQPSLQMIENASFRCWCRAKVRCTRSAGCEPLIPRRQQRPSVALSALRKHKESGEGQG